MKKGNIEVLVNLSGLKKEDKELFSKGEKLLKNLIKELKTFLPHNATKTVKINVQNIAKELSEMDLSKYHGFILDPSTLSLLKERIPDNERLRILVYDPLNTIDFTNLSLRIYGVFGQEIEDHLEERCRLLDLLRKFFISLMKHYNVYKEEDFVYTISGTLFPYLKEERGLEFLNSLKESMLKIKERENELRQIRENYKLYTYKLREKFVIKDKQRMYRELINALLKYSNKNEGNSSPFPSLLFVYEHPVHRDVFREWFLKEFLPYGLKEIEYKSFSPYSSEDGKEIFGYIPNSYRDEELILGGIFENQGNIVILEDLPSSEEFFERLFVYTNTGRIFPYGQRIEIFAPVLLLAFLEKEKFEKFGNYISFSYIFHIPPLFSRKEPMSFLCTLLYLYNIEKIRVTYDALSLLEDFFSKEDLGFFVLPLRGLFTEIGTSKILTREILQDFLRQL